MDADRLFVKIAASSRGRIEGEHAPGHGRATPWNEQTTHIEIVLAERKEAE